jgi:hypothetical protein
MIIMHGQGFTWKLFPSLLFYGGGFGGQESGTSKE